MPLVHFTPETARLAARKSAEARRNKKAAAIRQQKEEALRIKEAMLNPLPGDAYLNQRIAHTRAAIERFEALILVEIDPQKCMWIAGVIQKLSEVERTLSNRPLPGQLRPTSARPRAGSGMPTVTPE